MDSARATTAIAPEDVEALFSSILRGERGRMLRAQLGARHPERSAEEIEEAIQAACKRFVDKAEGISAPGQVYAWLRTTAHRLLNCEAGYAAHELPVDPTEGALQELAAKEPGPEEELIALEDEADLARLAQEVSASLPERQRRVLALYGAGLKRPEIAARLGLPERTVKYDLHEIMTQARGALARLSGGGCERGEPLVLRLACGLASAAESAQARLHLARCRRCAAFGEQLDAWREKAAALTPLPAAAAEAASPGVLGRLAHRTAEALSAAKQQLAGGAAQLKQQAPSTYYRALDPTPLAAARPGPVAAVVASCIAIGGGAATYCAQQGIDPLGAAKGLIAGTEEPKPAPAPPPSSEPTPVVPPASPASEAPPASEATPPAAEVKKESPPPPPPPEASFEPSSPNYPYASSSESSEAPHTERPRPAPVPRNSPPEFEGP